MWLFRRGFPCRMCCNGAEALRKMKDMMQSIYKFLDKAGFSTGRRKIFKNVYWAVLGKVVNIVSGLLVGILVARYLGPEQFGLMNYVISYVTLFSILATFGLDSIEVRELSRSRIQKEVVLGSAFAIRLIFAVATMFLIAITLWWFEPDVHTSAMVLVYSLSLIFSAVNIIRNYFTSIILNEYVVKTEIVRTVFGAAIKMVLLLGHCSLIWFIIASVFDFVLVGSGYIYSYHRKGGSLRAWRMDLSVARLLIRESFPLVLSGAALIIYQRINAVMIRNMMDNASVGQFSVAAKIAEMSIFIPTVIAQTVTPLLVQAHQHDIALYRAKQQQFMDLMVWSAISMALVMSLFAAPAIRLLYGAEYLAAIPVLQIMAWKSVFVALAAASGQLIIIEHLQRYAVMRNIVGCFVSVALNFLLIPLWGVVGSAVAIVLSVAFAGYISHWFIKPFRFLTPIQSRALFTGWKRIISAGIKIRHSKG